MRKRASELYFEEIGDNFDAAMSAYDVQQRIRLIESWLPADSRERSCLEIGCGTGRISAVLKPRVKALTVSDLSPKLAAAVGKKLGVAYRAEDACHLTWADNSFDLIVSSECIEHTPDPRQALREMARVLKPGGTVIVTSPNRLWYPLLWLSLKLGVRKFHGNEIWLWPWQAARVLNGQGIAALRLGGCHLFPWQVPGAKWVLPWLDRWHRALYPLMINYAVTGVKLPDSQPPRPR
jgi:SAM-dependent methyltransferase